MSIAEDSNVNSESIETSKANPLEARDAAPLSDVRIAKILLADQAFHAPSLGGDVNLNELQPKNHVWVALGKTNLELM